MKKDIVTTPPTKLVVKFRYFWVATDQDTGQPCNSGIVVAQNAEDAFDEASARCDRIDIITTLQKV